MKRSIKKLRKIYKRIAERYHQLPTITPSYSICSKCAKVYTKPKFKRCRRIITNRKIKGMCGGIILQAGRPRTMRPIDYFHASDTLRIQTGLRMKLLLEELVRFDHEKARLQQLRKTKCKKLIVST